MHNVAYWDKQVYIILNRLSEIYSEDEKKQLVYTTPITYVEVDRCFSVIKIIKSFSWKKWSKNIKYSIHNKSGDKWLTLSWLIYFIYSSGELFFIFHPEIQVTPPLVSTPKPGQVLRNLARLGASSRPQYKIGRYFKILLTQVLVFEVKRPLRVVLEWGW